MSCHYTGKEPSPKGLGYCAHLRAAGTRMRGLDGNMWIIKVDKNGRRSWKKSTTVTFAPRKQISKRPTKKRSPPIIYNIKRAHSMKEATDALKALQKIMRDDDEYQEMMDRYMNGPVQKRIYYPQKKLIVSPLRNLRDTSKKGYVFGQGGFAKSLNLLFDDPVMGSWQVSRKPKEYFYEMDNKVVTGSGGDPVFKIL
jgi:hypothetical protein